MTLSAQRSGKSGITVRTTYGPITNEVTEHVAHVRSFLTQLEALVVMVEKTQETE